MDSEALEPVAINEEDGNNYLLDDPFLDDDLGLDAPLDLSLNAEPASSPTDATTNNEAPAAAGHSKNAPVNNENVDSIEVPTNFLPPLVHPTR